MICTKNSALRIAAAAALVVGSNLASGQAFPSKPIRIWASTPGGAGDFLARALAQPISGPLGQQVIVENRPQLISIESVAKSAPDGYNLLWGGSGFMFSPLVSKASWDPVKEFSGITMTATTANVLIVHPSLPVNSVKELIALAKARPGELNYGMGGAVGASNHLAVEMFMAMAGVKLVRVAYKGPPAAMTGIMGGEVHMMITAIATAAPVIKTGRLKALAVSSSVPSALYPELPTISASGLPGYELVTLDFVTAPAGTPAAVINRLNQEMVRALNSPELKQKYIGFGTEATTSTPEQLAARVKNDIAAMSKVIKDANIKVE